MPKFAKDVNLERIQVGNFGFTAVSPDELGASGYTLADIVVDCSGSTNAFTGEMTAALKGAIDALKRHPRADNMMVRVTRFDSSIDEIHGYMLVSDIDPANYDGTLDARGMTALNDGVISATEAASNYGKTLLSQDFDANGIVIVITDGWNNAGKYSASAREHQPGSSVFDYQPSSRIYEEQLKLVGAAMLAPLQKECLESYVSILIGVNCAAAKGTLEKFHAGAGFTQDFIALEDASPDTIAKIGQFISESVSSQSQAIGTGGPSQSIANLI